MLTDALATYTWNSDNRLVKVEKNINGCKHDKFRKGHGFGHLKHGKEVVVYEEYAYLPMDWRRVIRKVGKYSFKNDRKGNAKKDDESEQTFVSIYDGEDESHEYLLTQAKFKLHGKCKQKESLKLFREFVGGPAADDIEHTRYNRLSLAMLKDGLGSTIALTGRDGKSIARIGYDAWGEFRWDGKDNHVPCKEDEFDGYLDRLENTRGFGRGEHNGWAFGRHFCSKLTPYLYTGRRFSVFTGQYNNRNRFYSPALGRFVSKDPLSFNGGNNLYRYADNNPMLFTDPWGLYKNWGTTLISGLPYVDRSIYGNTIPDGKLLTLNTSFNNGNCTITQIEFQFSQTVYVPKVGESFQKGFYITESFLATQEFADTVKNHELVHAVTNKEIADLVFPKGEAELNGKSSCTSSKGDCDSWANSLANKYIAEYNAKRTTANNKWHEIVIYGTGLNSYSPAYAEKYFKWFYPWLGK
jgi:RHS repeat-associated protein